MVIGLKYKRFKKIACIWSDHLHHQLKFKFMGGKVCLKCKGKTLLGIVNKLLRTKSLLKSPQVNFPANNLNFHWRKRWWDRIQAIFLNLFYFTKNFTWWIFQSIIRELWSHIAQLCCNWLKYEQKIGFSVARSFNSDVLGFSKIKRRNFIKLGKDY